MGSSRAEIQSLFLFVSLLRAASAIDVVLNKCWLKTLCPSKKLIHLFFNWETTAHCRKQEFSICPDDFPPLLKHQ